MLFDKQQILSLIGDPSQAAQAAQQLPDVVDHEQHGGLLQQFGIDPSQLVGGGGALGAIEGLAGGGDTGGILGAAEGLIGGGGGETASDQGAESPDQGDSSGGSADQGSGW